MQRAKIRKSISKEDKILMVKVYEVLQANNHYSTRIKPMGNWCYKDHVANTAEFIVTGPIAKIIRGEKFTIKKFISKIIGDFKNEK